MNQEDLDLINDQLESTRAILERARARRDRVEAESLASKNDNSERMEAAAAERRAGKDGRDWQILQQRIDLNETTLRDVLGGVDKSTEAKAVRRLIGEHILDTRSAIAEQVGEADLSSMRRAQADLAEALRSLQGGFGPTT